MRRLEGRFHLTFKTAKRFINALAICYLGEKEKRCRALIPDEDGLYVIQPSKSTHNLNILVLENVDKLTKVERNNIKQILKQEKIETIACAYINRPHQAKGFTIGFLKPNRFIKALTTLYLNEKKRRCRIIIPDEGNFLVIQPSSSTQELNTLILENFGELGIGEDKEKEDKEKEKKEKEQIQKVVVELDMIECFQIQN